MATRRSVLIADDYAPTRADVRRALESNDFVVCAEVADAPSAVEAAIRERPDICLLDIRMPGNGIQAAREIAQQVPDSAIVMLTISRDDSDLFEALRVGAAGYLLKDIDPDQLPEALEKVLAGEGALPGSLVAKLMDEFRKRGASGGILQRRQKGPELTPREWEVLELLSEGLLTSEIAHRLFISEVTVRTHVSSILKKLRVPDRAAAVRLFEEQATNGGSDA